MPETINESSVQNGHLCNTSFTEKWLIEKLLHKCEEFQKVAKNSRIKKVKAECISEGIGFISKVLKCTITFEEVDQKPYIVILKVPTCEAMNEAIEKSEISKDVEQEKKTSTTVVHKNLENIHKRECDFYEKFQDVLDLPLVKIFDTQELVLGNQPGYILMEYIEEDGGMLDFVDGLNIEQIKNVTRHIANFHAHAMLHEDRWRGKYPPIDLTEGVKEENSNRLLGGISRLFEGIKERLPKVKKIFTSKFFEWYSNHCETMGLYKGLCHGDLWNNNMMFYKNPDGTPDNKVRAIIDWQVINEGNLMQDLARLLVSSSDSSTRREAEGFILEEYYQIVKENLGKGGKKIPFTLEELKRGYEAAFLFQSVIGVWMVVFAFPQPTEERKVKQAQYARRVEDLLDDLVKILEKSFPEWL
uniref:CHK kinase-like domain-containing protein n=1 Tax=Acrobeloides nanus TaxID=290746 RepID=A0A914DL82_9BILA